jgi:hypothetical protein
MLASLSDHRGSITENFCAAFKFPCVRICPFHSHLALPEPQHWPFVHLQNYRGSLKPHRFSRYRVLFFFAEKIQVTRDGPQLSSWLALIKLPEPWNF